MASEMASEMETVFVLLPILPDKVEAWRRLCQEVAGTRREQYEASRQRLGVVHEQVSLLRLAHADVAVLAIEAADPERALAALASSTAPFDRWFRRKLLDVHGFNLNQPISGPQRELLFEWQAPDEERS